jgi:hypothetical protein
MAVLAGFGVVRFLKSSSDDNPHSQTTGAGSSAHADTRGYRDDFAN